MEYENFLRLQALLIGEGTQILRKIFRQRYRQHKNKDWENSDTSSSEFLESFSQSCSSLTLQREMIKEKDLTKFDISLLSNLITYMDDPLEKKSGKLKSENSAILELVRLRNKVAHKADLKVDAESFEKLWENSKKTLMRLGVTEESINKIRTGPVYEGAQTELPEALKLRNDCSCEMSKVEESFHLDPHTEIFNVNTEDIITMGLDDAIRKAIFDETKKLIDDPDDYRRVPAHYFLAYSCEQGIGTKLDFEAARKYYEEAIKLAGCTKSMCSLGHMYIEGRGTRDIGKGVELIERAANTKLEDDGLEQTWYGSKVQGVASAQFLLGECFEKGIGKPEDSDIAAKWFNKSSRNGSGGAAYKLGKLFYNEKDAPGNYEKTLQYWRLAASRGNDQAMIWLSKLYLDEHDPYLAEQWFYESLKRGNPSAIAQKAFFLSNLEELRRAVKECEKTTLGSIAENPGERILREEVNHGLKLKIWGQIAELQKKALDGHTFAQNILYSMERFVKVQEALKIYKLFNSESAKNETRELEILENMASSLRCQDIAVYINKDQARDLRKISCAHMTKWNEKSNVDLNARVCYTWIVVMCQDNFKLLPFLEVCRNKYTEEAMFPKYLAHTLTYQGKYEKALDITNQALEIFPKKAELLYDRAVLIRELKLREIGKYRYEDIIKAYKIFLSSEPIDDWKIADAFYDIAYFKYTITDNFSTACEELEKYYQQGLDAEKKLLPCFLPNPKSQAKKLCESVLKKIKNDFQLKSSSILTGQVSLSNNIHTNLQLTNPHRIESVIRIRKMVETKDVASSASGKPVQQILKQKVPSSLSNFVDITADRIITTKDCLFKNGLLNMTATEDPKMLNGVIHMIAMDKNYDHLNIVVYGLDEATAKNQLGFGSKFSIISPCFTSIGMDQIKGIRVDDPQNIFVDSDANKSICRFCWKENPRNSCAKCIRIKYCSKECQIKDCKILKHKFVCK